MSGRSSETWLAARLAWRQLWAERARLLTAVAGVMFAGVLVFMQLGFRAALFNSATALPRALHGDLFVVHPLTAALFKAEEFPRVRAFQTLAHPDVTQAVPVYMTFGTWKNPETGARRAIQLLGFDAEAGAVDVPGLAEAVAELQQPETVAFDRRSRPEMGPVPRLFEEQGAFDVEIGTRRLQLVGLFEIGTSFGADGNAITSELNFRRIIDTRRASHIDLAALRLQPGADAQQVQQQLREMLPADVTVVTQPELVARERAYWQNATPIGFIFAFGSLMGLIIGMVIVYQILFSDVARHIPEYATLKAIGFAHGYLRKVVMAAALTLAVLGFIPAMLVSMAMYRLLAAATLMPLAMDVDRAVLVFGLIFAMCAGAGLLAVRKLRDAEPADMF